METRQRKVPLIKFAVHDESNNDEFQVVLYRPENLQDYEQYGRRVFGWLNITRNVRVGRLMIPGLGISAYMLLGTDGEPRLSMRGPVPIPHREDARLYRTRAKQGAGVVGASASRYYDWRGSRVRNAALAARELLYYQNPETDAAPLGSPVRAPLGFAMPITDERSFADTACKLFDSDERMEIASAEQAISQGNASPDAIEHYNALCDSMGTWRQGRAQRGLDLYSGLSVLRDMGCEPSKDPRVELRVMHGPTSEAPAPAGPTSSP